MLKEVNPPNFIFSPSTPQKDLCMHKTYTEYRPKVKLMLPDF